MSGDAVDRLPVEYLDRLADAAGMESAEDEEARERRRRIVRHALRELAEEGCARQRGLHPTKAMTR